MHTFSLPLLLLPIITILFLPVPFLLLAPRLPRARCVLARRAAGGGGLFFGGCARCTPHCSQHSGQAGRVIWRVAAFP